MTRAAEHSAGRLQGKVALVVGGGTGIGKAIALAHANDDALSSLWPEGR